MPITEYAEQQLTGAPIPFGTTRMSKAKLVEIITANRAKHREMVEEAWVGYRQTVLATFEQALAKARAGKRVQESFTIKQPIDQTPEYDRALLMLQHSLDEEFLLDADQFQNYIMDQWPWKHSFLHSNSTYSKTASDLLEG